METDQTELADTAAFKSGYEAGFDYRYWEVAAWVKDPHCNGAGATAAYRIFRQGYEMRQKESSVAVSEGGDMVEADQVEGAGESAESGVRQRLHSLLVHLDCANNAGHALADHVGPERTKPRDLLAEMRCRLSAVTRQIEEWQREP